MKPSDIIIMNYNIQNYDEVLSKGYKLREDLPFIKFKFPINYVFYYDNYDRNFIWSLQCWFHLLSYIQYFEKTKDKTILTLIIDEVNNWNTYTKSIDTRKAKKHLIWDDMATGIRAQILSYLNQYCNNIDELVKEHISFLIDENNWRQHNHCIFMAFGLILLSKKKNTF